MIGLIKYFQLILEITLYSSTYFFREIKSQLVACIFSFSYNDYTIIIRNSIRYPSSRGRERNVLTFHRPGEEDLRVKQELGKGAFGTCF